MGTIALTISAVSLTYARFNYDYNNTPAALIYTTCSGITLLVLVCVALLFPTKTRADAPRTKEDTFTGTSYAMRDS